MRRYNIAALVVFIFMVGALFALTPRNTQKVQSAFLGMISPFLKTGSGLQQRVVAFHEGLKTLQQLEQDNKTLLVENAQLRTGLSYLRDLEGENNRLRHALEYRERAAFNLVPARIIARDSSTWWNTVRIDRGIDDGVEIDMPVLTEDGLVGKTTAVAGSSSTVVLISDENCKVAATVEGTQEQGIVKGERTSSGLQPQISLIFLSKNANLKPGMRVFSSGAGSVFPAGVSIGVIKEFRKRELDGYATIVPSVDLTTLEDVFVVFGKK